MKRRWGCSCVSTTSLKERELFPLFVFHARHTSSVRRAPAWRWREISDQKAFLTKVGEKLGVKELADWYKIPRVQLERNGGRGLFNYYSTLENALRSIYPEYPWDTFKFWDANRVPHGHWKDKDNIVNVLERAEKAIGIQRPEDWYTITLTDLHAVGFPRGVKRLELMQLLEEKYPDYPWDKVYILRGRYAQQSHLQDVLHQLFPDVDMKINARKEAGLVDTETMQFVELDIFIPSLKLAFEFQERHHYFSSYYQPVEVFQARDRTKKKLAEKKGITLITVPFWWDKRRESLIATIKRARPELLPNESNNKGEPIPEEMPPDVVPKERESIEDIGQPVTACFFTKLPVDPTNWWLFEKYDGIRGFWNPLKQKMYSRYGKPLELPEHIIKTMPGDLFLDGELWFGRDNFQESLKIATKNELAKLDWNNFKYMVFDIPTMKNTYAERYNRLEAFFSQEGTKSKYMNLVPKRACKGVDHLDEYFQEVVDLGGEGVILRDPTSSYESGRSNGFLKHKKFRDAEARIKALVGPSQYECELPNGVTFMASAATVQFGRKWKPAPGDIVSFKHAGFLFLTKKPKQPAIYRLRSDLTWEDVVASWKDPKERKIGVRVRRKAGRAYRKGYWADIEKRKIFLQELAAELGFDPNIADNWSQVTHRQIQAKEGGRSVLKYCNSSVKKLVESTFSDMSVQWRDRKPNNYWRDPANLRKFFDRAADENGFDPLDAEAWYSVAGEDLKGIKGGRSLFTYWKLRHALQAAYPEVDFAIWKNEKDTTPAWQKAASIRTFFDQYAREEGFNPLLPDSWYSVNFRTLKQRKGGSAIQLHNAGFKVALQKAYPELSFTRWAGYTKHSALLEAGASAN